MKALNVSKVKKEIRKLKKGVMKNRVKNKIMNLGVWKINFLATDEFGLYSDRRMVEAPTLEEAREKLRRSHKGKKIQFVRYKRLR